MLDPRFFASIEQRTQALPCQCILFLAKDIGKAEPFLLKYDLSKNAVCYCYILALTLLRKGVKHEQIPGDNLGDGSLCLFLRLSNRRAALAVRASWQRRKADIR